MRVPPPPSFLLPLLSTVPPGHCLEAAAPHLLLSRKSKKAIPRPDIRVLDLEKRWQVAHARLPCQYCCGGLQMTRRHRNKYMRCRGQLAF